MVEGRKDSGAVEQVFDSARLIMEENAPRSNVITESLIMKPGALATLSLVGAVFFFLAGPTTVQGSFPKELSSGELISTVAKSRGTVTVLNFWASWCSSCKKEIPALSTLRERYTPDELTLIGVSLDQNLKALSRFLQEQQFGYTIYRGGPDVNSAFQITGIPKTLIYGPQGKLEFEQFGYVPLKTLRKVVDRLLNE
jgi:thiol-disulfide isomerase/thioredoxin